MNKEKDSFKVIVPFPPTPKKWFGYAALNFVIFAVSTRYLVGYAWSPYPSYIGSILEPLLFITGGLFIVFTVVFIVDFIRDLISKK